MSKTIDIFAFKDNKGALDMQLLEDGGYVCTGIQKLIQNWVILFLTPKGSVTFDPERGSTFVPETQHARTEYAINTAFIFANDDVVTQLKSNEAEDQSDDERIQSAELKDIAFFGNEVSISVKITSQSGDSREVVLPVNTNPVVL